MWRSLRWWGGLDVEVSWVMGRTGCGGHWGDVEDWARVEVEGRTQDP